MPSLPDMPRSEQLSPMPLVSATPDGGVEILVELAKTGQIDPWNLDLIAVANQYLKALQTLQQSDLRVSGKVLLYLAILLRMKSDLLIHGTLLDSNSDELANSDLPSEDCALGHSPLPDVISLESVLKRRTSTRQPRIRPVTLNDLIEELQKIETFESRQALKRQFDKAEKRRSLDLGNWTMDDIETMAHDEFLEETVETVEEQIIRLLESQPVARFNELAQHLAMDRVTLFLSLLFLSARRPEVQLCQETFYGELRVMRVIEPETV